MALILASQSPRRAELLQQMGLSFVVQPADVDETADLSLSPEELVASLARKKAMATVAREQDVIIAADTLVAVDGALLGKPGDEADAAEMLRRLSGRSHCVHSGICVRKGDTVLTATETTEVVFRGLSEREIQAYIATGEPMDKAGAYGIQGRGAVLVEKIQGDYFNVVGLPVCRLGALLQAVGVDVWAAAGNGGTDA